ncbi:pyrroline-5-carboxylate reductase [Candidatus Peregrinibacteria bacterium]|nr:pyrroline-5-carboxylate reductase [Candidatus Peregrinibacteria bacterium]
MKNICVVGVGNMGAAIIETLKSFSDFKIFKCDKNDNPNKFTDKCDIFIIAVKSQVFKGLCSSLKNGLNGKLVISIMAGVSLKKLQKGLKTKKIVRVMPNLPLKVNESLSGWIATKDVSIPEEKFVQKILKCFGKEIKLKNENKIDEITALAGCGPAYFYLLTGLICNKAMKLGFSKELAEKIANQVFTGSAKLLSKTNLSAHELLPKIASKGGTTEVALKYMMGNKIDKIVEKAIDNSINRAKELNN